MTKVSLSAPPFRAEDKLVCSSLDCYCRYLSMTKATSIDTSNEIITSINAFMSNNNDKQAPSTFFFSFFPTTMNDNNDELASPGASLN
jgi:hypothetical protein